MTSTMLAARDYAAVRNWHVFPANISDGQKKSYKSAEFSDGRPWGMTKDLEEINQDFTRWPDAIGIPTGIVNNIFVVETDTPKGHDVDGAVSLHALEAKHGPLPATLMAESPSGSRHYYFLHPGNGIKVKTTTAIAPGIDVRGDGGMVIAPPSRRKDGEYRWINDLAIAVAPQWLIELVASPDEEIEKQLDEDAGKGTFFDYDRAYPPLDPERLREALRQIPSECWFKVGGALKNDLDESGFQYFEEYSRYSKKYTAKECRRKWDKDLDDISDLHLGSVYHLAEEHAPGWEQRWRQRQQQERLRDNSQPNKQSLKQQLIYSSKEFVAGYVPPDYLIDGLLQRHCLYSMTGPTGSGKTAIALRTGAHVALGKEYADKEVEKGTVLYFAGENPDDVRSRWIKLCEDMDVDPDGIDMHFLPGTPKLSNKEIRKRIYDKVKQIGPLSLLIIDTSAAYFEGDDESSRAQMANHAKMLRSFCELPGLPTVLVTCHPTKHPDMDNLLPAGGGSFVNAMDGNMVVLRERDSMIVEIDWHGKWRGPEFIPFLFRLVRCTTELLKDSKGRLVWTVYAEPVSDTEKADAENIGRRRQDDVLLVLLKKKAQLSFSEVATALGWLHKNGSPNRSQAQRTLESLKKDKLVEIKRGHYELTSKGRKEAEALEQKGKLL